MKRNPDSQPSICPVTISIRHPAVIHGMPACLDASGALVTAKDGIRAMRRWLGWKVESVAECCGVSVGTVRLWEHKGKQGLPVPAYALIALMLAVEQEERHRRDTRALGVVGATFKRFDEPVLMPDGSYAIGFYEPLDEPDKPLPPLGKGRYKAMIRSMADKAKSEPDEKST